MKPLGLKIGMLVLFLVASVITVGGVYGQTVVIDFEEVPTPNQANFLSSPFISRGFTFELVRREFAVVRDDQPNVPDTGSNTFITNGGSESSFDLRESTGAPFDLVSLLAAEGRNTNGPFFPNFSATSIQVDGTLAGGGTVTKTLILDLIAEENDALDFELFTFPGFTDLSTVRFTGFGGPNNGYSFALDDITVDVGSTKKIEVEIDIKPSSDPNSINCNKENGVIPVAILTTADFDAATVDHTIVTFEGASETHVAKNSGEARRHEEDVDGDGDTDLVFHFRLGDTGLTCISTEGTLIGETFDGQPVEGTDAVRMVGG